MITVLCIVYKRFDSLELQFESMVECGIRDVYIALDGPRRPEESKEREFLTLIASLKEKFPDLLVQTWIRSENLGCAASVISAIDWAIEKSDSLVILEDDLVLSRNTFEFLKLSLPVIESEDKVLMATATNSFSSIAPGTRLGYANYPIVWGWITTSAKWKIMRKGILDEKTSSYPRKSPKSVQNFLEAGKIRAQRGIVDAWDIPLASFMYAHGMKCLVPSQNYVSNIGFDQFSTHTRSKIWPLAEPISNLKILEPVTYSDFDYCYNSLIESLIFQIKKRHALSKIKVAIQAYFKSYNAHENGLVAKMQAIKVPKDS
jgi:GR25 family glycosyltransferase involved in LPS biosynthesis